MDIEEMTRIQEEIDALIDYYVVLTGKPDPEDEEDAQSKMVPIMQKICEAVKDNAEILSFASELTDMIEKWDPLEQWYFEVPQLKEKMGEFLLAIKPEDSKLIAIFASSVKKPISTQSSQFSSSNNNISPTQISNQSSSSIIDSTSLSKNKIETPSVSISTQDELSGSELEDSLSTKKSGLEPPKVIIPETVMNATTVQSKKDEFQKQIIQNSEFIKKETKMDKRLAKAQRRMAQMMQKEGLEGENINSIQPGLNNSSNSSSKTDDINLKSSLDAPKISIPNSPPPKKKITPDEIKFNSVDERTGETQELVRNDEQILPSLDKQVETVIPSEVLAPPTPIKISPNAANLSMPEEDSDEFNLEEFVPVPEPPIASAKNRGNALKITNISVSSAIIHPGQESSSVSSNTFASTGNVNNPEYRYQQLIELENKKIFMEKKLHELEETFSNGLISSESYQETISKYNSELNNYSSLIDSIRSSEMN